MVVSTLNPQVSYPEVKRIEQVDVAQQMPLYQLPLFNMDVIVAIGNANQAFASQNVVYFPVYLVKSSRRVVQIGVYEIPFVSFQKYLNDDAALNIEMVDEPLLYTFATESFISKVRLVEASATDSHKSHATDSQTIDSYKSHNPQESQESQESQELQELHNHPPRIKEESEKQARRYRREYHPSPNDNWVQQFMSNKHYSILDQPNDCLFSAAAVALNIPSDKIKRKVLAKLTPAIWNVYQETYLLFSQEVTRTRGESILLKKKQESLKQELGTTLNTDAQLTIRNQLIQVKKQYELLKVQHAFAKQGLSEVDFMKNVDSLELFKQSGRFKPDRVMISLLEDAMNIKCVVLSKDRFNEGDIEGVLVTNIGMDAKPETIHRNHIMLDCNGINCRLIQYKDTSLFGFKELPFDLRRLITNKCKENPMGEFSYVCNPERQLDLGEAKMHNAYDDNIVFCVYSTASLHALPGSGTGEQIPMSRRADFSELTKFQQWRRKLSDSWIDTKGLFVLDNHLWASVEHYYQASKFKRNNPGFYTLFALDSKSELSTSVEIARSVGSLHDKTNIRPITVEIDPDFYGGRNVLVRSAAQKAKFEQQEEMSELLQATKDAKLVQHCRGREAKTLDELMLVRMGIGVNIP